MRNTPGSTMSGPWLWPCQEVKSDGISDWIGTALSTALLGDVPAAPSDGRSRSDGAGRSSEVQRCEVIDFHCHLDLYPDPLAVRDECVKRGMYVLSVTTTPSAWQGTSALAADTKRIRTALGLHPQLAHERRNELTLFDGFLPRRPYIGEIGLDGARSFVALADQVGGI